LSDFLERILGSESERCKEFPVVESFGFFAHAAVCPLPARVEQAMTDFGRRASREGQFERLFAPAESGCRKLSAQLISGSPEEIAFVPSTSAGLSMVAQGLPWQAGDSVVIADRDFPANLHPWLALRQRGVEVRFVKRSKDGSIGVADLEPLLDASTRLVSLSSAHYGVGTPLDETAIGQFLHSRGILFCLDAIQSLGANRVSVKDVDFLVADAHKWLLGPQGIGILHVRKECFDRLTPVLHGWKSTRAAGDGYCLQDTARRYEPGSLNPAGLCGLHAALELLLEVGIDRISQRISALRARLEAGLLEKGCEVNGVPGQMGTGIISFLPPSGDVQGLGKSLEANGFALSFREDLEGRVCLRLSPHFYNTETEIDKLIAHI
jgi:cysteine desulfurase/selenocysteine lyase